MHEDTAHLGEARIARLLDGDFSGAERQAAEAHLADCPACRRELAEVRAILRSAPERRRVVPRRIVAAAAAAALLFFVWPWADRAPEEPLPHRDPALTTTLAPHAVRPLGTVGDTRVLEWTSVAGALRYRITLFDAEGDALWQSVQPDTVAAVPDSVPLPPAVYYWQVKAEASPGRWVESELIPFTIMGTGTP
jgi:hypothetical protein